MGKLYSLLSLLPFILALIIFFLIVVFFQFLPPEMPLFYSLPWGEEQLTNQKLFFIIPLSIVLISLTNLILAFQLHPAQRSFKKILILSSLLSSLILSITFIKIVLIFI